MNLIERARLIRRVTKLGISRETTLGWCRAFIEDVDRILQAVEKDNVQEEIGPNTARLLRLWNEDFLKNVVHESFISMRKYGESLNPNPSPKREEEVEVETEAEEPFTIKEKTPVGEYFLKK